jgi:HTH-type transcriptional regulator / antitoxin HigA
MRAHRVYFRSMNRTADDFQTPGQLILSLLEQRDWNQEVLATVMGASRHHVSRLVNNKLPIDAAKALVLADVFGIAAELFLEVQKRYDLALARIAVRPDPQRARRAQLFSELPVREMARRGWLQVNDVRDAVAVERELARFFGVARPDDIEILPHAAKKTAASEPITPTQLVWLYRVQQIAASMVVPPYSTASMLEAVTHLRTLLASEEEARRVPKILMQAGVRFVVVESPPGAKIDGVCFWLNGRSPVIGMSMRRDRIDNFWFVLRHECEHVLRGDGREAIAFDSELEGERAGTGPSVASQERLANDAAADFCVPSKLMRQFIRAKAPIFTHRDIIGFARTVNVHPGLVAGQLQHTTNRYDRFRDHLIKIRSIVLPNAMHDGWGDVAPVSP